MTTATASPSATQLSPLISRETLFGNPERARPQLSPDGKYLAYIAPDEKNVLQVWLRTVGQEDDRQLTDDKKRGIRMYFWTYRKPGFKTPSNERRQSDSKMYVPNNQRIP